MTSIPTVTIACDVDGVIAPVSLGPFAPGEALDLPDVNHGTYALVRAVEALRLWHDLGARVTWHSTWRPPYTDGLAEATGLPRFETFASHREFMHPTPPDRWWKLAAVERWLREKPADSASILVWIDDDIQDAIRTAEIPQVVLHDTRLVIVSPSLRIGLVDEEIRLITALIKEVLSP